MRRFMVHLVAEIDFEDGDEASDAAAQNYQKHLSDTVQNAARGLLLRTVKGARVESVSVAEIKLNSNARPPGPPMRANGVRAVTATCANCSRSADVNVDALPETLTVPEAGQRLRCSQCGAKTISTRPAWHTGTRRHGVP